MNYIYVNQLSKKQFADIHKLEKMNDYYLQIDDYDSDFALYYLAYNNSELAGLLVLTESLDGYEIDALVDAKMRRKGIFTELLKHAKTHSEGAQLFITYSENEAPFDYRKASFCGELMYQDLFMTLKKSDFTGTKQLDLGMYIECLDNCYILKKSTKGRPCLLGEMHLDYETAFTNVWGVEIRPKYRNQGNGEKLLTYVIKDYFKNNSNPLLLHVQSNNVPAVKLYKKLGFEIHATIDNYYV